MSKRITLTLPDPIYDIYMIDAAKRGIPIATLLRIALILPLSNKMEKKADDTPGTGT